MTYKTIFGLPREHRGFPLTDTITYSLMIFIYISVIMLSNIDSLARLDMNYP